MSTAAETSPTLSSAPPRSVPSQRLMSLDALRGFDMFWIIGADSLVYALHQMSPNKTTTLLATQLEHAEWAGFHFYDLIFPLFVFIAGVSLVFSLGKTIQEAGRAEALKRVFRRSLLLFAIGILYSSGFARPWPDMRLMGVLNRIALAYFFAGLLFCFLRPKALVGLCIALLMGYWALMGLVPIRDIQLTKASLAQLADSRGDTATAALFRAEGNPSAVKDSPAWAAAEKMFDSTTNYVRGKFDPGLNLSDHLDFRFLPGRKYDTFYDPEGLLSTMTAVVTCLLGVFAGLLLKNQSVGNVRKVALLFGFGIAGIIVGCLWGTQFPVIKKIWTSSYVLVAGGCSAILLGVFYLVVDMWGWRGWCQPFVWMGMNSITIYLVSNVIGGFEKLGLRFAGGDVRAFFDQRVATGMGELVVSVVGLLLAFWLVRFLYRRKIFLRL
jgi:predicted acyltransferase